MDKLISQIKAIQSIFPDSKILVITLDEGIINQLKAAGISGKWRKTNAIIK